MTTPEPAKPFHIPFKDLLILVLTGCFLFLIGNGNYTLFDNSEAHYARVAQEMATTGDYLNLRFNGDLWFVHPPLFFWITAAFCSIFGWTEFNLRLFEGLFGIGGGLITYLMARFFMGNRVATHSPLILMTSLYYIVLSRLAIFDTLLNFFILGSLYCFLAAFYSEKKALYLNIGAVLTALAVLTKGPIGLVHQILIIVPFLLWKRNLNFLWEKVWILPWILFLVVATPWYIHHLIVHGQPFFDMALRDYTWYRFFGVVEHQTGPWYYYFIVLTGFFPWIFFVPATIHTAFKEQIWKSGSKRKDFMMFCWLFTLITFIFFSIAKTKLPNYILSIFPFLSILIADYMAREPKWSARISTAAVSVLMIGLLIAAVVVYIPPPYNADHSLIILFFSFLTLIVVGFGSVIVFRDIPSALKVYRAGSIGFVLFLGYVFFPAYEKYKDPALIINELSKLPDQYRYEIINFRAFSPSLMFYLNRNIPYLEKESDLRQAIENTPPPIYVALPAVELPLLEKLGYPFKIKIQTPQRVVAEILKTPQ